MLINDDWITALSPSPPFNVLLHDRLLPSSPQCDPPSNYYSGPAPFPNYRQRTLYVIALLATPWWEERSPSSSRVRRGTRNCHRSGGTRTQSERGDEIDGLGADPTNAVNYVSTQHALQSPLTVRRQC